MLSRVMAVEGHFIGSSKVMDFGTNRKRVCDYCSIINSNLGPILPCFGDTAAMDRIFAKIASPYPVS